METGASRRGGRNLSVRLFCPTFRCPCSLHVTIRKRYSVVASDNGRFLAASGQQGTIIYNHLMISHPKKQRCASGDYDSPRQRISMSTTDRGVYSSNGIVNDAPLWSVAGSDAVGVIGLGFSPDGKTVACSTHQDLKNSERTDGQIIADVPIGYTNVRWGGFSSDGGLVGFTH